MGKKGRNKSQTPKGGDATKVDLDAANKMEEVKAEEERVRLDSEATAVEENVENTPQ